MADPRDDEQPEYTLYRARPKFLGRRRDDGGLRQMQQDAPQGYEETPPQPGRAPKPKRPRRRISPWRVLRWLIVALVAWLAISLVLFLVSAQVQSSKVSDAADNELGGAGYPLTSPHTILVLASAARTRAPRDPGAKKTGQPSRSDSILLLRIGG